MVAIITSRFLWLVPLQSTELGCHLSGFLCCVFYFGSKKLVLGTVLCLDIVLKYLFVFSVLKQVCVLASSGMCLLVRSIQYISFVADLMLRESNHVCVRIMTWLNFLRASSRLGFDDCGDIVCLSDYKGTIGHNVQQVWFKN